MCEEMGLRFKNLIFHNSSIVVTWKSFGSIAWTENQRRHIFEKQKITNYKLFRKKCIVSKTCILFQYIFNSKLFKFKYAKAAH